MTTAQSKRLVYIDATPDNQQPKEIIKCVASSYGYDFIDVIFKNEQEFRDYFDKNSEPIDILYIAAHGDKKGMTFEDPNKAISLELNWLEISQIICNANGLGEETNIYLACCQGGFRRAALTFMSNCDTIDFVAGLPCDLFVRREAIAFHIFLDHLERGSDSARIENAVTTAIDQQFNIYLRHEMDVEIALYSSGLNEYFDPGSQIDED